MTTIEKYFPQGIAVGNAFCNRVEERSHLKNSILSNEHIVLVAPRRYGKTSLITQILKDIELLFVPKKDRYFLTEINKGFSFYALDRQPQ